MPPAREPFSVPDPLAAAWDEMVRRNRLLQDENDPPLEMPKPPFQYTAPDDNLPMHLWQRARSLQVASGAFPPVREAAPVSFRRLRPPVTTPASDVRARGRIAGLYRVGADGTLDPQTGRPEISVSGLKGEGIDLPSHVRFYNTATGELDVDLSGSIGVGPLRVGKGVYVIGAPDAPKRR